LIGGLANARDTSSGKNVSGVWTLAEQRKAIYSNPVAWPDSDPLTIGSAFGGGFFAGYISHTQDGNATHALIVAPKATGNSSTLLQWGSTSVTGATSPFDGFANTATLLSLGISGFPAAQFCINVRAGGYDDWYLPSRYELDIAYNNLKPGTASNSTDWGTNIYSVPRRNSNFTSGNPAQTTVTAFTTSGDQFFPENYHWSSTESSSTDAVFLNFNFGNQSGGIFGTKTGSLNVRAFRRVIA